MLEINTGQNHIPLLLPRRNRVQKKFTIDYRSSIKVLQLNIYLKGLTYFHSIVSNKTC